MESSFGSLRPMHRVKTQPLPSLPVDIDSAPTTTLKPWNQIKPDNEFRCVPDLVQTEVLEEIAAACIDRSQNTAHYVVPDRPIRRLLSSKEVLDQQIELWVCLLNQMQEFIAKHQALTNHLKEDETVGRDWYKVYQDEYERKSRTTTKYEPVWRNQDPVILNMRLAKARKFVQVVIKEVLAMEVAHEEAKYNKAQSRAMRSTPAGFIDEEAQDLIALA